MIDLSFTKDPQWIEARQKKWDLIKEYHGDGLSKKQREQVYQYFMYGTAPKKISDFYFTTYFNLFPLQTVEGYRFVAANYFAPTEWTERELESFIGAILFAESEEANKLEKRAIFKYCLGDRYEPGLKFPFLIGKETEHRSFDPDPSRLFGKLNTQLIGWIYDPHYESGQRIAPYLLDFFFSLIPYQLPENLSHHIPKDPADEQDYEIRSKIKNLIHVCSLVRTLMRLVYTRFTFPAYFSAQDDKFEVISVLFNRFELMQSATVPQELIDHWQWVKRRSKMYELTFKIPAGMEDEIHQIEGDLKRNSKYIVNHLEKINGIDLQKAIQLHSEYKFDEHYFVEHRREAEQGGFDLIVFACTDEAVIGVLSEFLVTCGVTNLNCKEILG